MDVARLAKQFNMSVAGVEQSFLWEANRLSSVSHPGVVGFHGASVDTEEKLMVLEFCDGGELEDAISSDTQGSLFLRWARRIGAPFRFCWGYY